MPKTTQVDFPFKSWKKLYHNFSDKNCSYEFKEYNISRKDCDYSFEIIFKGVKIYIKASDIKYHKRKNTYSGDGSSENKKFEIWIKIDEPRNYFHLNRKIPFIYFFNKLLGRDIDLSDNKHFAGYQFSGNNKYKSLLPSLEFVASFKEGCVVLNSFIDPKSENYYLVLSILEWQTDYNKILGLLDNMINLHKDYSKFI